jgi:hypothetical protein
MTERKKILLRLDPAVHDALARWAGDELRSTNAQIEFVLRGALASAGRLPSAVGRMPRRGRPPAAEANGAREPDPALPPDPALGADDSEAPDEITDEAPDDGAGETPLGREPAPEA